MTRLLKCLGHLGMVQKSKGTKASTPLSILYLLFHGDIKVKEDKGERAVLKAEKELLEKEKEGFLGVVGVKAKLWVTELKTGK